MKLKDRKYKRCPTCNHNQEIIQWDTYGCDSCKKEIGDENEVSALRITVFRHDGKNRDYEFCSWKCLLKKLHGIRTNWFVSMPMLTYDVKNKGMTVKDFWRAVKEFNG